MGGYVTGGRCENINPPSQWRQLPYLRIISSLSNATDATRELYVQQLWELLANEHRGLAAGTASNDLNLLISYARSAPDEY